MEIILTGPCKVDIENIKKYYKDSNEYIANLLLYISTLSIMPYLGKKVYQLVFTDIRQLVFRKHKIIYQIYQNTVYIEAIVHSSKNLKDIFNQLYF